MVRDDVSFKRVQYVKQGGMTRPRLASLKNLRIVPPLVNETVRRKGSARATVYAAPILGGMRTFQKRTSMSDDEVNLPFMPLNINKHGRDPLLTFGTP